MLNSQETHLKLDLLLLLFIAMGVLWAALHFLTRDMTRALRLRNRELHAAQRSLTSTVEGTFKSLALAIEWKDLYVAGHVDRVAGYAELIARELGVKGERVVEIARGAVMHDIGKIAVPDGILQKPGPLTEAEWEVMRGHSAAGEELVKNIPGLAGVGRIIRHHHERWDGRGYPDGLSGKDIPLGARIVAVSDAFDAMTTERVYRRARTYPEAMEELQAESGTQFDPAVIDAFAQALARLGSTGRIPQALPAEAVEATLSASASAAVLG